MTKKERETLREAIRLYREEDQPDRMLEMLMKLAGLDTSIFDRLRRVQPITIQELTRKLDKENPGGEEHG